MIAKPRNHVNKPFEIMGFRQAMVAVLDQDQFDILGCQHTHQFLGLRPGNIRICGAVDQTRRKVERQRAGQHQVVPAFLQQCAGDYIGSACIGGRRFEEAVRGDLREGVRPEALRQQILCEVGRRGDGHKPRHMWTVGLQGQFSGHKRRNPTAHGRADQHETTVQTGHRCGGMANDGHGVIAPTPDGAVTEGAARSTVPGIVETEKRLSGRTRPIFQNSCLLARHVRHKAAKEHNAGSRIGARRRCCAKSQSCAVFGFDEIG